MHPDLHTDFSRGRSGGLVFPCLSEFSTGRSYPKPEARGSSWEELPDARGQGWQPTSKELWLPGHRRAERRYTTFKVRRGGHEEIPIVQGKEQQLHFAGAAVKRYPTSKVRETQVRW